MTTRLGGANESGQGRGDTWVMRMMKQLMKARSGRMMVEVVDGEVQKRER
jgi:hypothetical protein